MSELEKISMAQAGVPIAKIAQRYSCTEKSILNLLAEGRSSDFNRLDADKAHLMGRVFRCYAYVKNVITLPDLDEFEVLKEDGIVRPGVQQALVAYGMLEQATPQIPKKWVKDFLRGYGVKTFVYDEYSVVYIDGPYYWVEWMRQQGPGGLEKPTPQDFTYSRTQNNTTVPRWIDWFNKE